MITLILGESGSGKTRSIKNLDPADTAVLCPVIKSLPFKNKFTQSLVEDFDKLNFWLDEIVKKDGGRSIYIIDDLQFYILEMTLRYERLLDAQPVGSKKDSFKIFKDIAQKIVPILTKCAASKKRFYFLAHTEKEDDGFVCVKAGGKFGRGQIAIEGFFTTVLRCAKDGQGHFFETTSNGFNTVKSPEEMFASERIDNDLKLVDDAITSYYAEG